MGVTLLTVKLMNILWKATKHVLYLLSSGKQLCASKTHRQVPSQKGLKEATLATATCSKDITPEHTALCLLLLQVNVLVPGYYTTQNRLTYTTQTKHTKMHTSSFYVWYTRKHTHTLSYLWWQKPASPVHEWLSNQGNPNIPSSAVHLSMLLAWMTE